MAHSRNVYDVVVVGAGPAGSSAAFDLASSGAKVALIEKAPMPRYKTCGGGVVFRALKVLPFDISEAIDRECRAAELNLADAELYFKVVREYPIVSMTMRENLDYLMFRAAAGAGATAIDACRVTSVAASNGSMEVTTERDTLQCGFVVGADGAQSVVARTGGWRHRLPIAPCLEWEVRVSERVFSRFSDVVRFEFGPVPSGYAWIFPKKDHLSVGLGCYATGRIDLKAILDRFLQSSGIDDVESIQRHGYFIPTAPRREGLVKNRVVVAGDAAGFIDPVTGEGISYAVSSGRAAAKALIEGDLTPSRVKEIYLSEVSGKILREMRWGRLLGALLYRSAKVRNLLFRQYGEQLTQAFADVVSGENTYAALCKKHVGLRKLFLSLKLIGS